MLNINKIKGKFIEKGFLTQEEQAKAIGIKVSTYKRRLNKKIFNSDELFKMVELLEIENPREIFFEN